MPVAGIGETPPPAYLNNAKVEDDTATLEGTALAGGVAVLRRGKKTLAGVTLA